MEYGCAPIGPFNDNVPQFEQFFSSKKKQKYPTNLLAAVLQIRGN